MAVSDTWIRARGSADQVALTSDTVIANIPLNDTFLRLHGSMRVIVNVAGGTDPVQLYSAHVVAGIYTAMTVGGTVLSPGASPSDFNPPLERWLWWEQLTPVPVGLSGYQNIDSVQHWHYVPAQTPLDIKAQVKATTAVSVHLATSTPQFPNGKQLFQVWFSTSVLRSGT